MNFRFILAIILAWGTALGIEVWQKLSPIGGIPSAIIEQKAIRIEQNYLFAGIDFGVVGRGVRYKNQGKDTYITAQLVKEQTDKVEPEVVISLKGIADADEPLKGEKLFPRLRKMEFRMESLFGIIESSIKAREHLYDEKYLATLNTYKMGQVVFAKIDSPLSSDDRVLISKFQEIVISVSIFRELAPIIETICFWIGMLLLIFMVFFRLQLQASGIKPSDEVESTNSNVKFSDVAGCDEAKEEIKEIVDYLKNPERFLKIGARIPKGVLISGAPGTGKTLLAKAVAGEAGVPFLSIAGSSFVEIYVGMGAKKVRSLFAKASKKTPCIIFVDEIDAMGKQRGGQSHEEREQTLNALLAEMDGFSGKEGIVVIAATNFPESLDSALTRPGRFDRKVVVGMPDQAGRHAILKVHAAKVKLDEGVSLLSIAQQTVGYAGADLANLVNEAAIHAARNTHEAVSMSDFEEAKDKVNWGRERKRSLTSKDREIIAVHEAGHALIQIIDKEENIKLNKITIIPRGDSLGSTHFTPEFDVVNNSKQQLLARVRCLMAGRIAEELCLSDISSGASGDIQMASKIIRNMVLEWGMSNYGFVALSSRDGALCDPQTIHEAEKAVQAMLKEQYSLTTAMVKSHLEELRGIADALLQKETISGEVAKDIVQAISEQKKRPVA